VLTHGYGGNQDEMLPTADALHRAGFSVFTYDLRGTGESTGEVTFGAREREDLGAVVDYLVSRPDVDQDRIGALGFSMGGATTLMAAASDARIKAVVADSAWSDVKHWLRPNVGKLAHPNERFTPLSLKLVELRAGVDLARLRPGDEVARISPRPLLLISGGHDDVVPATDGDELFAAAREPKDLWHLPESGHGDTVGPGGAMSSERVTEFFVKSLHVGVQSGSDPAASA
jgi:dipeptidyl aminopeptidase/acylaminoacyl peptidase